jgi:hypothetical protein
MNRAKLILLYGWLIIAMFGSIVIATSFKAAIFLAMFCITCGILVVALSAKCKESTADIERLVRLSKWLETGLSFRFVRVVTHLLMIPLVLLQKLGCRIFNKRYQYHFGDIVLRPVGEMTEEFHTAVIIFPYAVVATVGFVLLLISHKG